MSKIEPTSLQQALDTAPQEPMKVQDLDFYGLLRRQVNEGRLFFNQKRAVIFDVDAVGALRQQLMDTLGEELAMGVLMRFGHTQGCKDAEILAEKAWETELDWLAAGPMLHTLAGLVHVESQKVEFNRDTGHFYMQGIWRNSYEAEQHLKLYGRSQRPVCWSLAGYASGYASRFFGCELLAIETKCISKGDDCCAWEIRPVTEWDSAAEAYLKALQPVNVHNQVQTSRQLQEQAQTALATVQESQQLLRTIIDATPDWIFIKDQEHRYRLVNQSYAQALHSSPADFVGKNDLDLGFPEELVKGNPDKGIRGFWTDDRYVMDTGETILTPNDPATIDGIIHTFHTVKTPLRDKEGNIWAVLAFARDISESKRAEEIIAKRAAELEAVAQVTVAASTILDTDKLLWEVTQLIKEHFKLYHAHIYLLNETKDRLKLVAGAGRVGRQMVAEGWSISMARQQSLVARAARTRQPVIVNDVRAALDWLSNPLLPDTRSEMAIPLIVGNTVLGVLDIQSDQVDYFNQEDTFTKTILASQIAGAIQTVRSFEAVVEAQQELAVINKIFQEISRQLDVERLLETVYEQLQRVLVTDVFFVGLYDPSTGLIDYPALYDSGQRYDRMVGPPLSGSSVEQVIQTGEPVLINRTPTEMASIHSTPQDMIGDENKISISLLFVPLRLGQQIKGVMSVQSYKFNAYNDRDIVLLNSIANQVIVALENIRLYKETEARARREQMLREITARVRSSVDVNNIMRITAQELGHALGRPAMVYLDENGDKANSASAGEGMGNE
jgi:PAS domain S-box-containing protein